VSSPNKTRSLGYRIAILLNQALLIF